MTDGDRLRESLGGQWAALMGEYRDLADGMLEPGRSLAHRHIDAMETAWREKMEAIGQRAADEVATGEFRRKLIGDVTNG